VSSLFPCTSEDPISRSPVNRLRLPSTQVLTKACQSTEQVLRNRPFSSSRQSDRSPILNEGRFACCGSQYPQTSSPSRLADADTLGCNEDCKCQLESSSVLCSTWYFLRRSGFLRLTLKSISFKELKKSIQLFHFRGNGPWEIRYS